MYPFQIDNRMTNRSRHLLQPTAKLLLASVLLVFKGSSIPAQVYQEYGKNRFTFAQSTFGYDLEYTPATGSSYRYQNGSVNKFTFGNSVTPVISITGLHFWGRAEFFTSISLPSINFSDDEPFSFSRYAGTGFKYFILPVHKHRLSPYIGSSIGAFSYRLDNAATFKRVEFPLLAGLTYTFNRGLLEIGVNYYTRNEYNYYVTKELDVPLNTPKFTFCIDYKYFLDLSFRSSNTDDTRAGGRDGKGKLNSLFIAAGPAYSFLIGRSSYNRSERPYLEDYKITDLFPDLGLGYYHYRTDAAINLSYRSYNTKLDGFDVYQSVRRRSLAVEFYKFLADYHGFVPFIGTIVSRENIRLRETESSQTTINNEYGFWSGGIIAGWDIRPRRVDWWGVRTNIRYFPRIELDVNATQSISLNQIEVNFLQMILYPGRFNIP